jgi:hypothetical protein
MQDAIYATEASPKVSSRYHFVSSSEIIELMRENGYNVRDAKQILTRKRDPRYVKHMVVFRKERPEVVTDEVVPEIIMTNSHDTTAGFGLRGGLYRFICTNGLVVGQDIYRLSIPHVGEAREVVKAAVGHISQNVFPRVLENVRKWMDLQVEEAHKIRLAVKALELRYVATTGYYPPEALLTLRRDADRGNSLWNVFNVIQENIVQGGIAARNYNGRATTSKSVTAIDANIRINTGLWSEAEKIALELS